MFIDFNIVHIVILMVGNGVKKTNALEIIFVLIGGDAVDDLSGGLLVALCRHF